MTRPPPPVAATCNLFCWRASGGSGSGSGSGGVGRGGGAAAPQVVRAPRGRSRSPSPTHSVPAAQVPAARRRPPARPLAAPSSRASPPRAPRAAAAAPAAALLAGTSGRSGEQIGSLGAGGAAAQPPTPRGGTAAVVAGDAGLVQAAACGAGRPGGGEMPPLPSPPVRPRPLGPPSLRPRPSGGAAAGAPPACPPPGGGGTGGREMALRLRLLRAASPPPPRRWPVAGVRWAREASSWTGPASRFLGDGRGGWPDAGREAAPPALGLGSPPPPRATPVLGKPFSRSRFLFPGCDRTARPGN